MTPYSYATLLGTGMMVLVFLEEESARGFLL